MGQLSRDQVLCLTLVHITVSFNDNMLLKCKPRCPLGAIPLYAEWWLTRKNIGSLLILNIGPVGCSLLRWLLLNQHLVSTLGRCMSLWFLLLERSNGLLGQVRVHLLLHGAKVF